MQNDFANRSCVWRDDLQNRFTFEKLSKNTNLELWKNSYIIKDIIKNTVTK